MKSESEFECARLATFSQPWWPGSSHSPPRWLGRRSQWSWRWAWPLAARSRSPRRRWRSISSTSWSSPTPWPRTRLGLPRPVLQPQGDVGWPPRHRWGPLHKQGLVVVVHSKPKGVDASSKLHGRRDRRLQESPCEPLPACGWACVSGGHYLLYGSSCTVCKQKASLHCDRHVHFQMIIFDGWVAALVANKRLLSTVQQHHVHFQMIIRKVKPMQPMWRCILFCKPFHHLFMITSTTITTSTRTKPSLTSFTNSLLTYSATLVTSSSTNSSTTTSMTTSNLILLTLQR